AMPDCHTLDITTIDDRDVSEQRGFGMLACHSSIQARLLESHASGASSSLSTEAEPAQTRFSLPELFDPEFIPESRLIELALSIEQLSSEERRPYEHHLTELKVTLIRRLISDQLRYINISKEWFKVSDLADIYQRRIGFGRIGGKSAGMLLAGRILNEVASEELRSSIHIPESYFLGSDLMYIFMSMNGLMHWNDEKYRDEEQIRAEYPQIKAEFLAGEFPPEIIEEFRTLLEKIGPLPIIVRSSSQLEDNLGTSFAGKYDSHFCPNQGTSEENLRTFTHAVADTYASTFKPEALLYRRRRGLQDYDERMAVLIQPVQGERLGQYHMPFGAGVAFSHNLYRWAPQIRREDGFVRLVWGMGTRAVERVGNDFPRLVALSHPTLHPDDSAEAIRYYSQRYVDVIDVQENTFKTLPVGEVLTPQYDPIRFMAQLEQDGYLTTPYSRFMESDIPNAVITFDHLLQRTRFASLMSEALCLLEKHYHSAVDVEFTMNIPDLQSSPPRVRISLLQCRPQSSLEAGCQNGHLPEELATEDIIFSSCFMVPQGYLSGIRRVIYVDPERYFALPTETARNEVGKAVAQLNALLEKKTFICVGPGRWGATNIDLGVPVSYADICYSGALIELSSADMGVGPEPSLGTHFFQDLMEAQIYPVAVPLDDKSTIFNKAFFEKTSNNIGQYLKLAPELEECVKLIEVASFREGCHIDLSMDDEKGQSVAFLVPDEAVA
ncbi:MAG TPA: PEP/pyruvate-binding domain-containing protein, partial [Longilinea sp.]|nr:PEP/pyruvate-binding domain-containing protein [Longilinea sp.]